MELILSHLNLNNQDKPAVVDHACDPSIQEAESEGLKSKGPPQAIPPVQDQLE